MLFGNVPMEDWPPTADADASGIVGAFVAAHDAIRGGDAAKAVSLWTEITWDNPPALPPLPDGHARLTMLTPGGFRFGQGPEQDLRDEALARPVFNAATALLLAIVDRTTMRLFG